MRHHHQRDRSPLEALRPVTEHQSTTVIPTGPETAVNIAFCGDCVASLPLSTGLPRRAAQLGYSKATERPLESPIVALETGHRRRVEYWWSPGVRVSGAFRTCPERAAGAIATGEIAIANPSDHILDQTAGPPSRFDRAQDDQRLPETSVINNDDQSHSG